ncbi:SGNH/GDSL hydrolase family protein [Chelativorans alearense]|uniref:SGNH/GDSL hydrolase family protein n=1 Tax=Chelativorans alearense TaxID=2681495 RepID=UPI0013D7C46E|nr:SGNH/GDSL hydrolase family protein [Chelativorans alearense]
MKQILAYGDSLTWGADPVTALRHTYEDLWPSMLEAGLNGAARVIHDGLGGRTTCFDDHAAPSCRNAVKTLPVALGSHMPLDLVILFLGTNDLKAIHGGVAIGAQAGMRRLIQIVRSYPYKPANAVPEVLIVAPPPCAPSRNGPPNGGRRIEESLAFSGLYAALAQEMGCAFFDAGMVAQASPEDGVHLDREATRAIGGALVGPVKAILARHV